MVQQRYNVLVANECFNAIKMELAKGGDVDWDDVHMLENALEGMSPVEKDFWYNDKLAVVDF